MVDLGAQPGSETRPSMPRPLNDIRVMPFDFTSAKSVPDRTNRDIELLNGMSTRRSDLGVRYRSPRCLFIKEPELMSVIPARETV